MARARARSTRTKGKGRGNGKGKSKDKGKGKDKQRTNAQAEQCWRAGACIAKKGANVSQCDLAGYTAPPSLNCTGCNLSRANLRGATFSGTNFTKANLSGACLVDADFTGATFANTTNLSNAIFCNTTMPDGSVNDSGLARAGRPAAPTCAAATCQSLGKRCGGSVPGWLWRHASAVEDALVVATSLCCAGSCLSTTWANQTTFGSAGAEPNQFIVPSGVAVASDELTAWVADTGNHRIAIWTRPNSSTTWTPQTTFGSDGSGPSQFQDPTASRSRVMALTAWVADTDNNRIAIWTRPNASSTTWTPQITFGSAGSGPSSSGTRSASRSPVTQRTAWVADPATTASRSGPGPMPAAPPGAPRPLSAARQRTEPIPNPCEHRGLQ